MTWHIKIGNVSWCQYPLPPHEVMLQAPRRLPLSCSHSNRDQADRMVGFLRGQSIEARVVEGECDQQNNA